MDYILTTDDRQLKIPAVSDEIETNTLGDPIRMVDGSLVYDSNHGAKIMIDKTTVAGEHSAIEYQELFGYLKGRSGRRETIYLDGLGTTIEGYIRIQQVKSEFKGIYGRRRELNIKIWEG